MAEKQTISEGADSVEKSWRCTACGYIHHGSEPPGECPVCGAPRAEFEAYVEAAIPVSVSAVTAWRCLNCMYVHTGDRAPAECPVCGALADRFELQADTGGGRFTSASADRIVILGGGIAGLSAVESIRLASPCSEITIVSKETGLPYYRLNLTRYLAGEISAEDLPIHPQAWYDERNVQLLGGSEAVELAPDDKEVLLADGRRLKFDRLVLTAGSHPFVPTFPGTQLEGVTTLRTRADADRILDAVCRGASCVVIGGGILGLETAGGIARRGSKVTMLESHEWLMPRQLNRRAGELMAKWLAGLGIELRTQAVTDELIGDGHVSGVRLKDGGIIPADLVILAAGVRPNSHLARRAGLEVGQGVVVDNHLFTSNPRVLAAGDIAEHRGVLYGNWSAAQSQGSIAGMNAAGARVEFGGIPRSNTLKVLGLDMVSMGKFEPEDGSYKILEHEADGRYARFVFRDGRMIGAVLLGDAAVAGLLKKAMDGKHDFSELIKRDAAAMGVVAYLKQKGDENGH